MTRPFLLTRLFWEHIGLFWKSTWALLSAYGLFWGLFWVQALSTHLSLLWGCKPYVLSKEPCMHSKEPIYFSKRAPIYATAAAYGTNGITNSNVWHDLFQCVAWLISKCGTTHSYMWHYSFHFSIQRALCSLKRALNALKRAHVFSQNNPYICYRCRRRGE